MPAPAPRSAGRLAPACGGVPWPKRPHHRGREGCGRVVERLGRQARTARGRAAFAGRELACGGLDGEGNGGVIERDEGELPERSRGARAVSHMCVSHMYSTSVLLGLV